MTRRRDVIKTLTAAAREAGLSFDIAREGGNHTIYTLDGLRIPIPRHNEIHIATDIYKQCEPKLGKDWWK